MSSFSEYYNKWQEETTFLSARTHDNENYKSLTDPEKTDLYDLVEGVNITRDTVSQYFKIHLS